MGRQFADALIARAGAGGAGGRDDTIRIERPAAERMCDVFNFGWRRIVELQTSARPRFRPPIDTGLGERCRVRVLAVEDSSVASAMEERLREDLGRTSPATYDDWRRRPLPRRMLDDFLYRFHKLL